MKFMVTSRKGAAAAVAFLLASPVVALTGVGAGVAQAGVGEYGPVESSIAGSLFLSDSSNATLAQTNNTFTDTFSISLNPTSPFVGQVTTVSFSGTTGPATGPVDVKAKTAIVRVKMVLSGANTGTIDLASSSECDYPAVLIPKNPSGTFANREGPYTATGTFTPTTNGSTTIALKQIMFDDSGDGFDFGPKLCPGTNAQANYYASTVTQTAGAGQVSLAKTAPAASSTIKVTVDVKPQTAPGTPSAPTAVAGVREATVSWPAATDTGGSPITGYTVTTVEDPTKTCTPSPATALTCTVDGLADDTAYTFTLKATNAIGDSAASDSSDAVTTFSLPGKPTAVTATPGYTDATVSWTAPGSNGGSAITGYTVTTVEDPTKTCNPLPATPLTCKVTGLSETTPYTFVVLATNAVGNSPDSDASSQVTTKTIVVPDAPDAPAGVSRNGSALLIWRAPASDGGSEITGYTVQTVGLMQTCSVTNPTPETELSCTVPGLTNDTAYTFTVIATNIKGNSAPSLPSAEVTPRLPVIPSPPAQPTAVRGNGQVTLTWVPGFDGYAPITSYKVTAVEDSSKTCTPEPETDLSCAVTGLTNGTAYTFTVTATNSVGTSVGSVASSPVTPATTPGKPGTPTVADANAEVAVSWTGPVSDGGSSITSYRVFQSPGDAQVCSNVIVPPAAAPSTNCTVSGLTNGTAYTFTVVANNDVGPSAPSDASSSATPATTPGTPAAPTAVAGDASATVTWVAATDDGGSSITGYTVTTVEDRTKTCTPTVITTLSCTVNGLTNGTAYTFTVAATNRKGASSASDASTPVTPKAPTAPGKPAAPTAVAGDASATVTWVAATDDGGSAITGYTITAVEDATKSCTPTPATALTCTVTSLTNGTDYTFTLVATNAVEDSVDSDPSNAITPEGAGPTQDIPSTVTQQVAGVKCQNTIFAGNWTDGDIFEGGFAVPAGSGAKSIPDPKFTVALTPAAPTAGQKVTIAVTFDKGITNGPSVQDEGKTRPSARVIVTGALSATIIVNGTPYGTAANPINPGQRFPGQTMTKANAFTFPAEASATNPVFVELETIAFDTKSLQPDFNWPNGPADTFLTVCNKSAAPLTATVSGAGRVTAQAAIVPIGVTAAVPFEGEVTPPPTIPPADDNGGGGDGTDTSGGTLPQTGGNPISSLWVALILFQIGLIMAVRSVRAVPVKTARHL
jgi:hypothetical protein